MAIPGFNKLKNLFGGRLRKKAAEPVSVSHSQVHTPEKTHIPIEPHAHKPTHPAEALAHEIPVRKATIEEVHALLERVKSERVAEKRISPIEAKALYEIANVHASPEQRAHLEQASNLIIKNISARTELPEHKIKLLSRLMVYFEEEKNMARFIREELSNPELHQQRVAENKSILNSLLNGFRNPTRGPRVEISETDFKIALEFLNRGK